MDYRQFKLTKKQHNGLFPYRQIKWKDRYEYFYNDKCVLINRFCNWKGVLLYTILFPVYVLIVGLGNIQELLDEYSRLYNQKKAFESDSIQSGTRNYNKIMRIIKENIATGV